MFYLTFSLKFSYVKFFKISFIQMVKIGAVSSVLTCHKCFRW